MANSDTAHAALSFIELNEGAPYLRGARCGACGMVLPGAPFTCPSCGERDALQPMRLAETGELHTFTIVHRSFPGVATPFIAAAVDLDGGGSLKGTLIDTPPDPAALAQGLKVKLIYRDTGQKAADGKPFISYFFAPRDAANL
jgi:uncharacterized protein